MPDDPHVHTEGSFVLAAEKQVDTLIKAAKLHKIQLRVLSAVCFGLLVVSGLLGYVVKSQYDTTQTLRNDSIAACRAGNDYKAGQTKIWVDFIDLLLVGNKDPKAHKIAEGFISYVDMIDAPRNCTATYGASAYHH